MARPLILFFADAHVDDGAWENRPIRGDSLFALEQIEALACSRNVVAVVGAGDLIDKQRNRARPIAHFHRMLDGLNDADIPFYYLQGQHDQDDPPWLSGHRHAQWLHRRAIKVGDFAIYGIDFTPRDRVGEELEQIPRGTDILVAHQTWGDWMGSETLPQCDFAQVPVVATVVTGDYHRRTRLETRGRDGQNLVAYSPGATNIRKINEPDVHNVLLMADDGTFTAPRLRSRQVLDWPVLNRPEDLDQFAGAIDRALADADEKAIALHLPEALRTPLLRVTYSHRLTDAVRRIQKLVGRRAHLFWSEIPPEEHAPAPRRGSVEDRDDAVTALSELPRAVDPEARPEVFSLLEGMLSAGARNEDPEQALAAWRTRFLAED